MPAMFGGTPIGAMQYGGTPIAEAMIDGQVVYRSIIRVTPEPPTFHDGEPWVTLPTVEGVTYSVEGTPGYDASVTVTATAQAGYELDGTSSWAHTFGPPPRYTASLSGGSGSTARNQWATVSTRTIPTQSAFSGSFSVEWEARGSNATVRMQVLKDGIAIADRTGPSGSYMKPYPVTLAIPETAAQSGDVLTFRVTSDSRNSLYRSWNDWSWSLA